MRAQGIDAIGDDPQRIDVEAGIGFVENGEARLQKRHLENVHALLLAAREADIDRALQQIGLDVELRRSRVYALHEIRDRQLRLRRAACGCAFSVALRKVIVATPGISTGY